MRTLLSSAVVASFMVTMSLTWPAFGSDTEWTSGTGTVYTTDTGDKVGIGTTGPNELLEVSGNSEPMVRVTHTGMTGSPYFEIGMNNGNNAALLQATSGKDFKFWNGQYVLTLKGDGKVGIGTTSPSYKLHVAGTGYVSSSFTVDGIGYFNSGIDVDGGSFTTDNAGGWPTYGFAFKDWQDATVLKLFESNTATSSGHPAGFEVEVVGDLYVDGETSTGSFVDRTPYPETLSQAYASVLSMSRLPDGAYDPNDSSKQLDHSGLDPFVLAGTPDDPARNLSATVSAQNEVIKDMISRIEALEAKPATQQETATPDQ